MGFGEFTIEFIKACATVLAAFGWPLVVLIIFFVWLYRRERLGGSIFNRKRSPLSRQGLSLFFTNLEYQLLNSEPNNIHERRRKTALSNELRNARLAIEQQKDQTFLQTLANLSQLAALDDRTLADRLKTESLKATALPAEVILPESTGSQKS